MAFLGSLGKAIGLGQFKSRDIVQGIATGVNEQLKDSMDKTDENVSRLAQLRLTKALRNQELDDDDLRENLAAIKDMAKQLKNIHNLGRKELKRRGKIGREWAIKNGFNAKGMCKAFIDSMKTCFDNFEPRKRFTLLSAENPTHTYSDGVIFNSKEIFEESTK